MKAPLLTILSVSLLVLALGSAASTAEPAAPMKLDNAFFAFDNGTGGNEWPLEEQAAMLKELGYAGIGYSGRTGTEQIPEMLAALDAHGLKMFSTYVYADIAAEQPEYSPNLQRAIEQLKGRDTVIWLTVRGLPDNGKHDDRAVVAVRQVGQWAKAAGLRVALYPHVGFYVGRFEDAMRIADKVDMPNVGSSFNLCHWVSAEGRRDYAPVLKRAMPRLMLVSINGTDTDDGTRKLIQTLDQGKYDVFAVLKTLRTLGYDGPIGLQCYNIKGDRRENLKRSMDAWRKFVKRMEQ
ncbi:MAG: sugar phosphate isomerase/epimerase [Candidatus Nealsonbacteria bacterium]|nr:sugar phosphate isomerase/epimerase [Candidatus Nealsonbacteria bacterium]